MRLTWDEYFIEIVNTVKKRSTCCRRQVGAIIVRNKRILSTGYNGVPSGINHCIDVGCLRDELKIPSGERHELCRGLHAEQNAIISAANSGVSIDNSVIYVTNQPCILCAKMIINSGIRKIIYQDGYPDKLASELMEEAKIEIVKFETKEESETC